MLEIPVNPKELGLSEKDFESDESRGVELANKTEKKDRKVLRYLEYIAGPSHVHTEESEAGEGATHRISELVNYLEDRIGELNKLDDKELIEFSQSGKSKVKEAEEKEVSKIKQKHRV